MDTKRPLYAQVDALLGHIYGVLSYNFSCTQILYLAYTTCNEIIYAEDTMFLVDVMESHAS